MNDFHTLYQGLIQDLPEAADVTVDAPTRGDQAGWLDVRYEGKWVVVEWRPGMGFGVSLIEEADEDPAAGLFEGPDQIFRSWREAQDHLLSLLQLQVAEVDSWSRRAAHG